MKPPPNHTQPTPDQTAQAREALHSLFEVTQAMTAVADAGRFDTAYDDVPQHFAFLLKLFAAQLDGLYGALADIVPTRAGERPFLTTHRA